ncbi:MAG: radical SAM protein [Cyanobacteria bacterium SIG29]|nr:radical SAM protein [Cyanobacteria bacterium SIG29]
MPIAPDKKPISFSFNNTERCQSRCITCNGWKTPAEVMQKELTLDEWKVILTNLHNWMGNYQFIISGGEPFIRDDIFEMAQFASDLGDTVNVVTNGLALPDKVEQVLYSAFNNITFSLNSVSNPQIHNISRGRDDAFQRTIDALQNLNYLNKHTTGHKWKNIFLSTVVMPSNLSEIKPIAEFCKVEGIGVSYQLMDNGDAFSTAVDESSQIYGTDIKTSALKAIDEMIELKKQGYPICNGFAQLDAFKVLIDTPDEIQNIQCMVGENNFAIDPYGNCRICFCMKPIGNLRNSLPQDLWYSKEADEVREHILNCKMNCRLLNCNFK